MSLIKHAWYENCSIQSCNHDYIVNLEEKVWFEQLWVGYLELQAKLSLGTLPNKMTFSSNGALIPSNS